MVRTSAFDRRRLGDAARKWRVNAGERHCRHGRLQQEDMSAIRVWRSAWCPVCVSIDTAPSSSLSLLFCLFSVRPRSVLSFLSRGRSAVSSLRSALRAARPQAPRALRLVWQRQRQRHGGRRGVVGGLRYGHGGAAARRNSAEPTGKPRESRESRVKITPNQPKSPPESKEQLTPNHHGRFATCKSPANRPKS